MSDSVPFHRNERPNYRASVATHEAPGKVTVVRRVVARRAVARAEAVNVAIKNAAEKAPGKRPDKVAGSHAAPRPKVVVSAVDRINVVAQAAVVARSRTAGAAIVVGGTEAVGDVTHVAAHADHASRKSMKSSAKNSIRPS